MLTRELVAEAPKVLLHDHLDGGLRPATILELKHLLQLCLRLRDDALRAGFREVIAQNRAQRYAATPPVDPSPRSTDRA